MSWPFLFGSNTMKSQMLWKSSCNGGPMFKLVLELLISWDRAENTCNPIFVNGAFVALSITTISPVGPITISLFISQLQPAKKYVCLLRSQFWCHRPFTNLIWTVIPQSFQGYPKFDRVSTVWPPSPPKVRWCRLHLHLYYIGDLVIH